MGSAVSQSSVPHTVQTVLQIYVNTYPLFNALKQSSVKMKKL